MIVNEHNSQPYMQSLSTCLNKVMADGYTEDFTVTEDGLVSIQQAKTYTAAEVDVINFFRFEGTSNPDDEAVLYVIETADGTKGTLTDAYGVYTDGDIGAFMKNVASIRKKSSRN